MATTGPEAHRGCSLEERAPRVIPAVAHAARSSLALPSAIAARATPLIDCRHGWPRRASFVAAYYAERDDRGHGARAAPRPMRAGRRSSRRNCGRDRVADALLDIRPDSTSSLTPTPCALPQVSSTCSSLSNGWRRCARSRRRNSPCRMAQRAFAQERAIVIFPAGAPARRIGGVIQEPPWERSAVSLARKYDAPLIPVNIKGPFSFYYHAFDLISRELRNITLFRELLNKAGKRYDLTIGPAIHPGTLTGDADFVTRHLRDYVRIALSKEPDLTFGILLWIKLTERVRGVVDLSQGQFGARDAKRNNASPSPLNVSACGARLGHCCNASWGGVG